MLTKENNELLTRVGPDTRGGGLLRRYWYPVLKSEQLEAGGPPIKVRLLGEDFVAFRADDGRVGMMDEYCPHRRTSLLTARNEDCALRCLFHGWKFDLEGSLIEAPSEPSDRVFSFISKVRTRKVQVRESAQLIWAYIGLRDAPQFPDFEFNYVPDTHRQIAEVLGRCNWVQLAEGLLDSAHISHLHASVGSALGRLSSIDRSPRFEIESTPWGMHVAATRHVSDGEQYTRISEFVMPSWEFIPRPAKPGTAAFDELPSVLVHQVPIDDATTKMWFISWRTAKPLTYEESRWNTRADSYREVMNEPLMGQDRAKMRAGHMTGMNDLLTEDMLVAEMQGRIADRSGEYLGSSDTAIARFRRILLEAIQVNEQGGDPAGTTGDVPYRQIMSNSVLHPPDVDWRERVAM